MRPEKEIPGPGQESVWDYPRPPALRACDRRIRIVLGGDTIADTTSAFCVLETSHPPGYYLPPGDIDMSLLTTSERHSFCEWKGLATYYDLLHKGNTYPAVAWTYLDPSPSFSKITGHLAFYPHVMDACYVGEEKIRPQPGNFYGGWITSDVVGPFKGEPGTAGW